MQIYFFRIINDNINIGITFWGRCDLTFVPTNLNVTATIREWFSFGYSKNFDKEQAGSGHTSYRMQSCITKLGEHWKRPEARLHRQICWKRNTDSSESAFRNQWGWWISGRCRKGFSDRSIGLDNSECSTIFQIFHFFKISAKQPDNT